MPRRERIDFPGAFFHITARGNGKQTVFLSDDDRYYFLSCLREAHDKHGILAHVYCLMDNHYHLFLELLRGGLSKAMHLVNMRYANYFNLKHGRCGHTFQSRFRAILVEAAAYARELAPYIHLNPVRAGIVERPEEFPWSNYREYLGLSAPQPWTSSLFVLRLFGPTFAEARANYEAYVLSRLHQKLPDPLKSAGRTGILGSHEFIEHVRKRLACQAANSGELPRAGRDEGVRPSLEAIRSEIEALFGPRSAISRRLAIYVAHTRTDRSLREIGDFFAIGNSGITDICRRMRKEMVHNETLARSLEDIEERLRR